jgi:hypothetical protein
MLLETYSSTHFETATDQLLATKPRPRASAQSSDPHCENTTSSEKKRNRNRREELFQIRAQTDKEKKKSPFTSSLPPRL